MKKDSEQQAIIYDGMKTMNVWNSDDGWTIHTGDGSEQPYEDYMGLVPILYRSINQRARAVSSMPFSIMRDKTEFDSSDDWQNKVNFMPNPQAFFYAIEASLCIAGRAYFLRQRNAAGYPKAPQYFSPASVSLDPKKAARREIEFVRYENSVKKTYRPEQLIYFWQFDPRVELGPPMSCPASVASAACGVLYNVDEFAEAFFKRGAIKSMLLTVQGSPPQAVLDKIKAWWKRVVSGIRNAWGADVINADAVKPVVIGEGIKELENVTLTAEKKEDVATAFDIPFSILFANAANYATAERDKLNWYEDSIVPECNFIEGVLNEQVFEPMGLSIHFRPETLDIFQEDEKERALALAQLVSALATPDEVEIAFSILGYELSAEAQKKFDALLAKKEENRQKVAEQMAQPQTTPQQIGQSDTTGQIKPPTQEPPQTPPPPAKASPELVRELNIWQSKAIKAVERGDDPNVPWVPAAIPLDMYEAITGGLTTVTDVDAVRSVFANASMVRQEESDPLRDLAAELKRANDLLEASIA